MRVYEFVTKHQAASVEFSPSTVRETRILSKYFDGLLAFGVECYSKYILKRERAGAGSGVKFPVHAVKVNVIAPALPAYRLGPCASYCWHCVVCLLRAHGGLSAGPRYPTPQDYRGKVPRLSHTAHDCFILGYCNPKLSFVSMKCFVDAE